MLKYIISLLVLFLSCGRQEKPAQAPSNLEEVQAKVNLYSKLIFTERADIDGFIDWDACDASLTSGLLGAALPGKVNLKAAVGEPGKWYRRSLNWPECFSEFQAGRPGSRSTISRDMFTGILWWLWKNNDLQAAIELMDYARTNDYIMGEGDPARIALMPNLTKLLADIIYVLSKGEKDYWEERVTLIPFLTYPTNLDDYEAHIQMWQILLDGEVNKGLRDAELDVIKAQVARRSDNPLFQAAYGKWISGDMSLALQGLMHPRWPANRLPDWTEYCTSWWVSKDAPYNLEPCPGKEEGSKPSGGEVIAIFNLIIKE